MCIEREDWRGAASLLLSRFHTFVHGVRGGELTDKEEELFSLLVDAEEDNDNGNEVGYFGSFMN